MKKDILWYGPCFSFSGYAQHNRAMIFELDKLGWNIQLIPTEPYIPEGLDGVSRLLELVRNDTIDARETIAINLVPPPAIPQWGKWTILFTTLENITLHEGAKNRIQQFDEVWVPCTFNYSTLARELTKKMAIEIVQEGVYTKIWNPGVQKDKRFSSNLYTFFFCGDWSYRKGNDILIRAYAKAFNPTDPVRLLLFTHYQGRGANETLPTVKAEIQDICKRYNIKKLPKIDIIPSHYPDSDLPGIFKCADVGIFPTRGEAWGLPIIQLMSLGIACITSNQGGQIDYCTKNNSYLIKTEKLDTIDDKVNCTVDFYKEQKFIFPDVEHTAELMKHAYNHRTETEQKGKIARQNIADFFDWEVAGKIADRILTKRLKKL